MSLCVECGAEMGHGWEDSHRYNHQKWLEGVPPAEPAEPEEKAIDAPHPLYIPLWRIAVALEEQNRFNWQWLEQNKVWHEENKEYPSRMLAIHEESAARDKAHRERMESAAEEQATFTNELMQKSYEAFLSSLKSPSKELVQAVREALASDIRKSTGVREP